MRSYDSRNDRVSARTRAVLATSSCSLCRARLARVRRSRLGCSRALDALCRARLLARRFFISRRQASRAFARLALDDDSPAATTSCSLRRRDLPQQPSLPRRCARAPTATGARHRSRNHVRRISAHRARSSTSPATPATFRAYIRARRRHRIELPHAPLVRSPTGRCARAPRTGLCATDRPTCHGPAYVPRNHFDA